MIKRDFNKVPRPLGNPAAGLLEDTIEYHGLSQSKAAEGMCVSRSLLNEVIKGKRGVSVELALRAEAFFGMSAELLVDLQAKYEYRKAYHAKRDKIRSEVKLLECV